MHVGCQFVDTYRARRENNASQILHAVFKRLDTEDMSPIVFSTPTAGIIKRCENDNHQRACAYGAGRQCKTWLLCFEVNIADILIASGN